MPSGGESTGGTGPPQRAGQRCIACGTHPGTHTTYAWVGRGSRAQAEGERERERQREGVRERGRDGLRWAKKKWLELEKGKEKERERERKGEGEAKDKMLILNALEGSFTEVTMTTLS